jgi:hypothetical protein
MVALLFALAAAVWAGADQPEYQVEVVGTAFSLGLPDGKRVGGDELVGMVLTLGDPGGARRSIRINATFHPEG